MKEITYIPNVVDFAREIITLDRQNRLLQYELEACRKYEKLYLDSLNQSIKHSGTMMANLLQVALDPKSIINLSHAAKVDERRSSK